MKTRPPPALWVSGAGLALAAAVHAQPVPSITDLSLEQLSSIEVTSVGKRVQRLADVAGSVFVIHQDDIRRSGAVTLPEALRLAPNLQVARADASQYAISARGFNSVLANKMLVLVDGRTVYSPLFSGVFWEVQDLLLDDVERIEVLSGAGGTLYGSNAVNGVINIITRSAAETTGALLKAGAGNQDRVLAARLGGGAPEGMPWRVYAKRYATDATRLENGASAMDDAQHTQAGFRADRARDKDQWTLQGDLYEGEIDQRSGAHQLSGANLLARWSRDHAPGHRTQLQAYFDRTRRNMPGAVDDTLDTWDLELQQTRRPGGSHELLWGAGYRLYDDSLTNLAPGVLLFDPAARRQHLWNVFAQDEFALAPSVRATLGLKAEHNSYTGLEWLPTARISWQLQPEQLVWASVSRAVRTPSRIDRDVTTPVLTLGGSNFDSEVANVFEVGYRAQPLPALSYSFTLFHHDFDRLRSVDVLPGGTAFGNHFEGRLSGLEAWGSWRVADRWRLQAGYTFQRMRVSAPAGSPVLAGSASQLGNDPRNQGNIAVGWEIAPNMELDLLARHVGSLPDPAVPAYTAIDLRWGWRVRPDLDLSVAVRNLNDPSHPEWGLAGARAEIPRSFMVKAVWRP